MSPEKGDTRKAAIRIWKWDQNLTREPEEGKGEALVELEDGNPGGEVKVIRKEEEEGEEEEYDID